MSTSVPCSDAHIDLPHGREPLWPALDLRRREVCTIDLLWGRNLAPVGHVHNVPPFVLMHGHFHIVEGTAPANKNHCHPKIPLWQLPVHLCSQRLTLLACQGALQ